MKSRKKNTGYDFFWQFFMKKPDNLLYLFFKVAILFLLSNRKLFFDLLVAELMALFSNQIVNRMPQLNLEWR